MAVAVGKPATIRCEARGSPEPKIHWLREGRKITSRTVPNVRIRDGGKTLQVSVTRGQHVLDNLYYVINLKLT